MSKVFFTILLIFLIPLSSLAQDFETISARFVREFTQGDVTEQVSGFVYCQLPDVVTLKVTSPVDQWMVFERNLTTIYYPEYNTAFRITSRFSPYPPFVQNLAAAFEADYGLGHLGYRPRDYEVRGDTIVSHWSPPRQLARALGETILKMKKNKIVYIESRSARGSVMRKSLNTHHEYQRGAYFPTEMFTTEYFNEDSTLEWVSFSDLVIDSLLPTEVTSFCIPSDADVREVEW
jgi:hypothetical protein